MSGFHLAQVNIARFSLPKDHPDNAGFMDALDPVNAQADGAPGFIWRLTDEGNDAVSISAAKDDPRLAVNMSLWTDVEVLANFVYRNADHLAIMRRRREWLEHIAVYQALWWVPAGYIPTVAEGLERIALLGEKGPTETAFTFRQPFPAPGSADDSVVQPILDKCA